MDLNGICRLCAETNCTLHPIFDTNEDPTIAEKIEALVLLQVFQDDGLPHVICTTCNEKLNSAYDFRLQIISTYEKLKLDALQPIVQVKKDPDEIEYETEEIMIPLVDIKTDNFEDEPEDDNVEVISDDPDFIPEEIKDTEEKVRKRRPYVKKEKKARSRPDRTKLTSICSICGKVLKRDYMHDHVLQVHGEALIECDICGKKVKTKRNLWHHKKKHEGSQSISCDKCGKIFASRNGFRRHYSDIHLGIRKYSCQICDKNFPRSVALTRHMITHTGEQPHSCPYCGRGFGGRWNLKQHIRLHTQEKPYVCKLCPEAFTQNVTLKLHVKNKHTDNTNE